MRIRHGLWMALALLAACAKPPAEQRLRERIGAMQEAVAQRQVADFMEGVAGDFTGNGGIDRAALHNLVRLQVMRHASIGTTMGPISVQLQGERATVEFQVVLTGGAGELLPERAQGLDIRTRWRESDGEWQVFSAEWKEVL